MDGQSLNLTEERIQQLRCAHQLSVNVCFLYCREVLHGNLNHWQKVRKRIFFCTVAEKNINLDGSENPKLFPPPFCEANRQVAVGKLQA